MSILATLSISAIRWSDRGRWESSFRISRPIRSFTLSLATASPWTRLMLELKKYLSSKMPWGQCTYLFVVTRLTVDSCISMSSATSRKLSGLRWLMPFSKKSF